MRFRIFQNTIRNTTRCNARMNSSLDSKPKVTYPIAELTEVVLLVAIGVFSVKHILKDGEKRRNQQAELEIARISNQKEQSAPSTKGM